LKLAVIFGFNRILECFRKTTVSIRAVIFYKKKTIWKDVCWS